MNIGRIRVGLLVGRTTSGGTARYTREVYRALKRRDDVAVVPIGCANVIDGLADGLGDVAPAVVVPMTRQVPEALFVRFGLGGAIGKHRLDVVHGTRQLLPRRPRCRSVLTVHDLFSLTRSAEYAPAKRLLLPRWFSASLAESDTLVCVSRATLRELTERTPRFASKATVVSNAPPRALLDARARRPRGLGDWAFSLVVSDANPRKNLALLLSIWPSIVARTGMRLVVAGDLIPRKAAERTQLIGLLKGGVCVAISRPDDGELRWMYEHAHMLLLPSFAEGWGLPVTEALAFGTPVVATDVPAVREAPEGHAVVIDPNRPSDWVQAIVEMHREGRRVRPLATRGWDSVAEELVSIYRTTLRGTRERGSIGSERPLAASRSSP